MPNSADGIEHHAHKRSHRQQAEILGFVRRLFAFRPKKLVILSCFNIFTHDVLFGRSWQNYSQGLFQGHVVTVVSISGRGPY
jgi:hypothetical protein